MSAAEAFAIRPAEAGDATAIAEIVTAAFGQPAEARLIEALHRDGDVVLSLVATLGEKVVGHILFSPLRTPHVAIRAVALAPMAVAPGHQNQGIGSAMIEAGLEILRSQGWQLVVVLGHTQYYPRFGFDPVKAEDLISPYAGPHLMALELEPDVLEAFEDLEITYAPAFSAL